MITRFYIKRLNVKSFRGLNNVNINKCLDVNLILGDNNAGKTSLLESIYLLRNGDIYNFVDVAKCRQDKNVGLSDISFLYPIGSNSLEINASSLDEEISFISSYKINTITFDKNVYFDNNNNDSTNTFVDNILKSLIETTKKDGKDTSQIVGNISYNNEITNFALIDLDFYGKITKTKKIENKIVYISPNAHYSLSALNISKIIKNKNYYNILIKLLRLFDPSIEDILVASSDGVIGTYGIELRRKGHNQSEPIYLFGDGLKKAIVLATYLVEATNGILLIDEVETSLHHSLFGDVFAFLLLAAKQFDVQLFIATHSIEAIDSILSVSEERLQNTSLITLKNTANNLTYRCLDGVEAKKYRDNISMEVR